MKLLRLALSTLFAFALPCGFIGVAQVSPNPLEIRSLDTPIRHSNMPLTQLVGFIGVNADGDFVVFGIEVETENGQEPLVSVNIPPKSTLGQALMEVVAALPSYSFEAVAPHLVNIFPTGARIKPSHMANLRVASVQLSGVWEEEFLCNPHRYLPELREAMTGARAGQQGGTAGSGFRAGRIAGMTGAGGTPPRLDLNGMTVRDDLNLVSEVSIRGAEKGTDRAFGWVYSHETKAGSSSGGGSFRVHDAWDPARHQKQ